MASQTFLLQHKFLHLPILSPYIFFDLSSLVLCTRGSLPNLARGVVVATSDEWARELQQRMRAMEEAEEESRLARQMPESRAPESARAIVPSSSKGQCAPAMPLSSPSDQAETVRKKWGARWQGLSKTTDSVRSPAVAVSPAADRAPARRNTMDSLSRANIRIAPGGSAGSANAPKDFRSPLLRTAVVPLAAPSPSTPASTSGASVGTPAEEGTSTERRPSFAVSHSPAVSSGRHASIGAFERPKRPSFTALSLESNDDLSSAHEGARESTHVHMRSHAPFQSRRNNEC